MKNAFLSFIDYQILEFVANKSIASMKDIQVNFSHLPPEDIEARVRYLCFFDNLHHGFGCCYRLIYTDAVINLSKELLHSKQ